jgi:hypothetical protein
MGEESNAAPDGKASCRKCGGSMSSGKAIVPTWGGIPDFPCGPVVTMTTRGTGKIIDCMKCSRCGYSVTA